MYLHLILAIVLAVVLFGEPAQANPTQYGSSGLLNVPTADTLDSANLCVGFWGNCSSYQGRKDLVTIMPVTLTLGIGTIWEVYGTYPNVAMNGEEPFSGRGTTDIGSKIRFYGGRSSKVKLAADIHMSRHIDDVPKYNGITDTGGRLILSLKSDVIGAHFFGGYNSQGTSRAVEAGTRSATEYPYGLGVEFNPSNRSKLTLEVDGADAATFDGSLESSLGFQYYLSPHLTFNLSLGVGMGDAAAQWRMLVGLSTCQGVGAYIKPVPVVTRKGDKGARAGEVIKPTKVLPITPLLIKTPILTTPSSKFEVPVDPDMEEVTIRPYGSVVIAQQPATSPVTLPKMEPHDPQIVPVADETMPPIASEEGALEYTLTRVSGITPLYGVRLRTPDSKSAIPTPVEKMPGGAVTAYRKFRVPDNLFEFDNTDMLPEVQKSISELAEFIRKDEKWVYLRIDGHTDGVGSVKYNLDLSLRRAISVANYLINREGIDPAKIFVRGMGKSTPIADNSTDEGRRLNRRFEIVFLVHKGKGK
jgi:outer membrane protein OmpA-like peptidoglycan-associated protein